MVSKYMIRCDMEGVTGVVSYEQAEPGKPEYAAARNMFMAELASLVEGLHEGGADGIVIYDEHYYGRNIDLAVLPAYAKAICGKPPFRPDWAGGLDETYTALILHGLHAKAGTSGALLPHSYEHDIRDIRLNGMSVGEIGMEAAIAGDFGVPVHLVTGDAHGIAEARELLAGIEGVIVKEGVGETGAVCSPLDATTREIRDAAKRIVVNPPPVKPYSCGKKVKLEVKLNDTPFRAAMKKLYAKTIKKNTVIITGKSVTEVWSDYWMKKLVCLSGRGGEGK